MFKAYIREGHTLGWCTLLVMVTFLGLSGLTSCTQSPAVVVETSPIDAAKRRVVLHRWRAIAFRSRALLNGQEINPSVIETLTNEVTQFQSELARQPAVALPRRQRQEMAALTLHLKALLGKETPAVVLPFHRRGFTPRFQWPLKEVKIVSKFGLRVDPFDKDRRTFHNGVDLKAVKGEPVRPCDAGQVIEAGWRGDGCGLGVTLKHHGGFVSDYCHLSKIKAQVGQYVRRDTIIGEVGNTGRSTGYHLHWGMWRGGHAQNPLDLMKMNEQQ